MKFTKRIYLRYVFNGNEMDLNPSFVAKIRRNPDRYKKRYRTCDMCLNADNSSDTVIKISKYIKNCKDIIRTLNGIDFLMLTQFAPFQK